MYALFPNETGGVFMVIPAPNSGVSVFEVARKETPYGKPFLIVDPSVLPTDVSFFNAWQADFSNPDGYGIGTHRWFIERAEKEIAEGINVEQNMATIAQIKDEVFQIEGVRL